MRYIVYADRLFLLQFIMNCCLLMLTKKLLGSSVTVLRTVLTSLAGSVLFCLILLFPGIDRYGRILLFVLCGILMVRHAFNIHTWSGLFRAVVLYHGAAFFTAGLLQLSEAILGERGRNTLPLITSGLGAALLGGAVLLWQRRHKEELLISVTVCEGECEVEVTALIDSGNSLYDPISGRPVCVVERSMLEGRMEINRPERFRVVPYHSLGKKHGLMQAVEIEKMKMKKDGQELVVHKAVLGLYEGTVTESGRYQMILHPALLKD